MTPFNNIVGTVLKVEEDKESKERLPGDLTKVIITLMDSQYIGPGVYETIFTNCHFVCSPANFNRAMKLERDTVISLPVKRLKWTSSTKESPTVNKYSLDVEVKDFDYVSSLKKGDKVEKSSLETKPTTFNRNTKPVSSTRDEDFDNDPFVEDKSQSMFEE